MAEHAKLSPSSAHRWINCTPSVALCATMPEQPTSKYADEGTQAHTACEIVAAHRFGQIDAVAKAHQLAEWVRGLDESYDSTEMLEYAEAWADFLQERMLQIDGSLLFLEKRMNSGVPGVWGTSDAVLVSADTVEIDDVKYGMGVRVDAEDNEQLMFYALGALDTYGDLIGDTTRVIMTIWQPRLDHVSSVEMSADDLRAWRTNVATPAAALASAGEGEFAPSVDTCRWCPAAGRCEAQVRKMAAIDFAEDPRVLGADDLSNLLAMADEAATWAKAVSEAAHKMAVDEGTPIPGYKVVRSAGRRSWSDQTGALEACSAAGIDWEVVSERKMLTIGALEKKLGKSQFTEILGEFAPKSEGKLSLVPESNPKKSVDRHAEAVADFTSEVQ